MTPAQRLLARHALGLPRDVHISYRNYYAAGIGSVAEKEWDALVAQGMAEKGKSGKLLVGFVLTAAGAHAALDPGESLDPEDF
jgi:hypothetical protein